MKRSSIIFLISIFAVCLFTGCSSQGLKSAESIEPKENSVSEKTETKTSDDTMHNNNMTVPVFKEDTIDVNMHNDKSDDASNKKSSSGTKTDANTGSSTTRVTETGDNTKNPRSDDSQGANVPNNSFGAVGECCISNQTKDNITVPHANYELDFDKDGTISSADYKLSGMSQNDFASELVSNGNVGTSTEARQLINGEITVMCGMFNGTCSSKENK